MRKVIVPAVCEKSINRFWSKVDKRSKIECWPYLGQINKLHGYGYFWAGGTKWRAHRYSFFITTGKFPDKMVCHHCDNRKCVNPSHLYHGTHADNMRDMFARGRHWTIPRPREANPRALLTSEIVNTMRRWYSYGEPIVFLARVFKISPSQASRIVKFEQWLPEVTA